MRANGETRFFKVSGTLQKRAFYGVSSVVALWLTATAGIGGYQMMLSMESQSLSERQAEVATAEQRVNEYKGDIEKVARQLKKRQDVLDGLAKSNFSAEELEVGDDVEVEASDLTKKISAAVPGAAALAEIEAQQNAFAERISRAALRRAKLAESKVARYGLDAGDLAGADGTAASGGPFIPAKLRKTGDARLDRLASALLRMKIAESALAAIPSAQPSTFPAKSSSYGYRRDPFTGAAAMHSGIDFPGAHGSPIFAAADGVVSFAGRKGGYGNCIEITHGDGLITRYAHMSRLVAKRGQQVTRGESIGKMGSTGRSTGTHLHFEVRVHGKAVDPAKFLGR